MNAQPDRPVASPRRLARRGAGAALAALLLAFGCAKAPAPGDGSSETAAPQKAALGAPAPAFTLPDLQGKSVSSASFAGKVVILDFWATWCPPCREEIPHLVRLQSKYRAQGLEIVGVSLDAGGAADVAPFADEHDVNYTMLIGDPDQATTVWGANFLPTTFVLDREGKIVKRFVGYTAPEVFEEAIRPLLGTTS